MSDNESTETIIETAITAPQNDPQTKEAGNAIQIAKPAISEGEALTPQIREMAELVGGVGHIPEHKVIGKRTIGGIIETDSDECDPECPRCALVMRVELKALEREKSELFGDWGGIGW